MSGICWHAYKTGNESTYGMKFRTGLTALLFFLTVALYAQGQITLSTELVKINGEVFYAHSVKKGETLYSLSKAYGVAIEEIVKKNPSLAEGLKAGAIIYIEKRGGNEDKNASSGIAQSAATAIPENAAEGKMQSERQTTSQPQRKLKGKRHSVKWYEDINDIAKKYGVPAEDILDYNGLPEDAKLTKRQILWIPPEDALENNIEDMLNVVTSEKESAKDTTGIQETEMDEGVLFKSRKPGKMDIAMILPLNSGDPELYSVNYMDFYAGALLALDRLKSEGMEVTLNLIDSRKSASSEDVMQSPGFAENDIIIGPVVYSDLKNYQEYSKEHKIPVISPMDPSGERLLESNEFFIQAPTHSKYQMKNLIDQLMRECSGRSVSSNVILLHQTDNTADTALVRTAKELLDSKGMPYREVSYRILQGRDIISTIKRTMDTASNNIALVLSNDEAFVSDVVRNLNLCTNNGYKVTLFGMSKWRNFESVDIDLFHKMNLHLSLPFYIDYSKSEVKDFLFKYRALFNAEPTPYSFQGYDLTYYFASRFSSYGNGFVKKMKGDQTSLLQTNLQFVKENPLSGLENCATRNVIYNPDFTITLTE